jgi:hypothetical protein
MCAPICCWKWETRKRKRCWQSWRNVQLCCTRKLAFNLMNWQTWAVTHFSWRHLINGYLCEVLSEPTRSTLTHIYVHFLWAGILPLQGFPLTLILLTWRIWWAPNNASKWQIGLNSAFKGLNGVFQFHFTRYSGDHLYCIRNSSNTSSCYCYVIFFRLLSIKDLAVVISC